jgi:Tfp pilus assembly PilM family ATPase
MRAAVKRTLGVEDELIDSVLEDALIDPRPALEPFVHPILEQLELSRAYLAGKHGMKIERVFLMGLAAGAGQWSRLSEESLHLPLVAPDPFAGFTPAKGVDVARPQDYLVALGAALAAMEVDA